MVVKSTQFVGKTLLLTVTGELLPTAVDNTVSINGNGALSAIRIINISSLVVR